MTKADAQRQMEEVVAHFKDELRQVRTGRAHPGLVEDIQVEAYGTRTPIKGLANVAVPEPRQILITPWDKSLAKEIEKAISVSPLGITPTVTGDAIRVSIPELTAERRAELSKVVGVKAEAARVALRNARETFLKDVKSEVDSGSKSEDELDRAKKEVQTMIDAKNDEVAKIADEKTAEITKV